LSLLKKIEADPKGLASFQIKEGLIQLRDEK
jgi:hypothetical protein